MSAGSFRDTIIIGGGVIGLSIAYELSRRGISVRLFDQGPIGQESSWAGAGILPPGNPAAARSPEARLRAASHALWGAWTERLRSETGHDNGYIRCGGLELRADGFESGGPPLASLAEECAAWRAEGVECDRLTPQSAARCEPALAAGITDAYRLPDMGQVRNPRHVAALTAACLQHGVDLCPGTPVWQLEVEAGHVQRIQTSRGAEAGGRYIVASGAWTRRLLGSVAPQIDVHPMRGQIALLRLPRRACEHVLNVGPRYVVPRPDGRVLIGSTEELVEFDKRPTAAGIQSLLDFGQRLVPALADATLEKTWAGLRPRCTRTVPYIGPVPQCDNLFVAAGHFRAGLQLSPITGKIMADLIEGRREELPTQAILPASQPDS